MPSHMNDPHSVEIGMGIIHMRTMPILGKSGLLMLRSGQEVLLARQNGVENHSHHERHRDAVGSEDGLEQRREVGENVADLGETDANGQAQRGDGDVALRVTGLGNHLESGQDDIAEHHDGAGS